MALSTQASVLAKRTAGNQYVRPATQGFLKWFWSYIAQFGGSPLLQVVPFSTLGATETVIADVACRLYALVLQKATATLSYTKLTDSATTSSDADSEYRIAQVGAGAEISLMFPYGQPFANGITMQGNTLPSTGVSSGANGGNGFAIIGAA